MKKNKLSLSKLALTKETITGLQSREMEQVQGGEEASGPGATILYCGPTRGVVCGTVKVVTITIVLSAANQCNGVADTGL